MADIKKISYRINGEFFETVVKFSADGVRKRMPKGFSVKLPGDVALAMQAEFVSNDTLDLCVAAFRKIIKDFETQGLKRELVIIYKYEASSRPRSKDAIVAEKRKNKKEGSDDEVELTVDDFNSQSWYHGKKSYSEEKGLKVEWSLAERVTYGKTVEFQDADKERIGRSEGDPYLLWTQEREDFFLALDAALDALVLRASKILDVEPEKLSEIISTVKGPILLAAPGNK